MEQIKKTPISPDNLGNLCGHNDLEGFAKFVGVDYNTLLEINQKNSLIIGKYKQTE